MSATSGRGSGEGSGEGPDRPTGPPASRRSGEEADLPAHPPTLEQVAARAGVSRATASRVLRGESNVSASAREQVLQAAEQLSYTPNLAARSLVTRRSDSIAFVVAESEDRLFHDPFFLDLLRAAQAVVAAAGMQLVFSVVQSEADNQRLVHFAAGGHLDGILLLSLHGDSALPHVLESAGVPTVLTGRPLRDQGDLFFVDADNVTGARLATEHLIGRGCRRIATITGPQDMSSGQDRRAGYELALADAGIDLDPALVGEGAFTVDSGRAQMAAILARTPDVDAVFAASDLMALGAMRALSDAGRTVGREVGRDVAVIGFDDIEPAALASPALSTVRQPISEIGRHMTSQLLRRINGRDVERVSVFDVELVLRASG